MEKHIVIGAGILGASTAYHLAKAGAHVTLVDRHDAGQATDAAAGIICPWLSQRRNQAWYRLAKGGARYYTALIKQLEADGETDTGYKRVGVISLHTDDKKLDKMEERAHKRHQESPEIGEIIRLSPAETKRLFPPLSEEYSSVYISGAARVSGKTLRQSLINAARKHGAVVVQGNASLALKGFTQLLKSQNKENGSYYEIMLPELDRINSIVGEFLLLAKPQVANFKKKSIISLLQDVTHFLDEGCGISEERLTRLGEPFYTTKEKGTGLGLTVSYRIIENHGGTINIQSQAGEGTEVSVILPA